jgi:hypothetical protein
MYFVVKSIKYYLTSKVIFLKRFLTLQELRMMVNVFKKIALSVFSKNLLFQILFFQLRKSRSARRSTSITSGMSDRAQSPTKTKTQQGIISDLSFKFHLLKETHCLSDINDSLAKLICHNLGFKTNINFI